MQKASSFVSHLEASIDGTRFPADSRQTLHDGRPVLVRYDLEAVANTISPADLRHRPFNLWRLGELLPMVSDPVSLGENASPLLACPTLGAKFGINRLLVKDESTLPTGSFKSRGLAMAITMARHFGSRTVAIPTAGNAGGAMAAYAARAGLEAFVFMPEDTPTVNVAECVAAGAKVLLVKGLIDDCGKLVGLGKEEMGWFDVSTLKEPYRLEGKKTMGFELAEQLDWQLPDVILYPTGGGTGLIGMWKAFQELAALGWIDKSSLPRMIAVQSEGCCPVVRAFLAGSRFCERFDGADTVARGIRVPAAVGDFLILDAIRESSGHAVAVPEQHILDWMHLGSSSEGIAFCPESATCIGALEILLDEKLIGREESVVIFNCATGNKYRDLQPIKLPGLDPRDGVDWNKLRHTTP